MKNCLILGSGRSGTSMVAGTLSKTGYFMGDSVYPPNPTNPKGMFEDKEINAINEDLLDQVVPGRPRFLGRWFFRHRPVRPQRWLAAVPPNTTIPLPDSIAERIRVLVDQEPYCFKDPRFSYTLPAWQKLLRPTVYVVVFRDPGSTAKSIVRQTGIVPHLRRFSITMEGALRVWQYMHEHILQAAEQGGEWLFLHFNQVLTTEGRQRLATFTEAEVDHNFPQAKLRHAFSDAPLPPEINTTYARLCKLADYQEPEPGEGQ